ncbi:MAG: hypothetical protein K2H23_05825 [Oscillospiraceae bacterium]|nr:hypothetical protein [Oscillospiraceae bacterium]
MRSAVAAVMGIILICAGLWGKRDVFFRIRGVHLKGRGILVMRVVYVISGILLALSAFAGYFR